MTAALDPGEQHTRFVSWAQEHGVNIDGIAPARFVGRGMGIVAAKDIKKGDRLVHISNKSLIHVALPSIKDIKLPVNATVHGKLAAVLALWYAGEKSHDYQLWIDVWPSKDDFYQTMPFYFAEGLQNFLPPAAKDILAKQLSNLERDWNELRTYMPNIDKATFSYTWIIVNTRTFYWDYPDLPNSHPRLPKRRAKLTADDCYVMCPFIDYFNHSDVGCDPTHDAKGYLVTADRDYKAGEEVFVSYGPHTNDFLLVEYGFLLEKNKQDSIPLDQLLLPSFDHDQINALKDDGFYGNYTLSSTTSPICHRTQAALRLLVLDNRRYSAFVSGDDDGTRDQPQLNHYLSRILTKYSRKILSIIEDIEEVNRGGEQKPNKERRRSSVGTTSISHTMMNDHGIVLIRRWKQIQDIVNRAVEELRE
ncbi:hypothetical protein ACN47E_000488 [Coniothyrium glycines]